MATDREDEQVTRLLDAGQAQERKELVEPRPHELHRLHNKRPNPRAWKLCALLLFIANLAQLLAYFSTSLSCTRKVNGSTDLPSAGSSIKYSRRRFGHPIRAYENGTLFMPIDPSEPQYVGRPSPAIDKAWEDLLKGRYFRLNAEEIDFLNADKDLPRLQPFPKWGDTIETAGYYGGIDVFHSLHCLNGIRMHLDLDYYGDHLPLPQKYMRMHIDHCINQIREGILCHGDTTPVTVRPVIWADQDGQSLVLLGETERMHTCRDHNQLREFVDQKNEEMGFIH